MTVFHVEVVDDSNKRRLLVGSLDSREAMRTVALSLHEVLPAGMPPQAVQH